MRIVVRRSPERSWGSCRARTASAIRRTGRSVAASPRTRSCSSSPTSSPPRSSPVNVFLAAVHHLLLEGADHELATHYRSVCERRGLRVPRRTTDARHHGIVRVLLPRRIATRSPSAAPMRATQTNEVGRCAALRAALASLHRRRAGRAARRRVLGRPQPPRRRLPLRLRRRCRRARQDAAPVLRCALARRRAAPRAPRDRRARRSRPLAGRRGRPRRRRLAPRVPLAGRPRALRASRAGRLARRRSSRRASPSSRRHGGRPLRRGRGRRRPAPRRREQLVGVVPRGAATPRVRCRRSRAIAATRATSWITLEAPERRTRPRRASARRALAHRASVVCVTEFARADAASRVVAETHPHGRWLDWRAA